MDLQAYIVTSQIVDPTESSSVSASVQPKVQIEAASERALMRARRMFLGHQCLARVGSCLDIGWLRVDFCRTGWFR